MLIYMLWDSFTIKYKINKNVKELPAAMSKTEWHGAYETVLSMQEEKLYLQQLVTAKLLATSRLSMCGVSLKSAIPNWTMPTRNALYSWSAPLGNKPPETDTQTEVRSAEEKQQDYSAQVAGETRQQMDLFVTLTYLAPGKC